MANLTRWDPFSELTTFQDRFNQLFSQTFGAQGHGSERSLLATTFIPPVDVYEDDHSITIQAEVPGVKEEDLELRLENNILTISGERKLENEEKKENFHRVERHYGRFFRSFTLPTAVNPDGVKADFENGVLKITVAKSEAAKPKQIRIGAGKTQTTRQPGKAA